MGNARRSALRDLHESEKFLYREQWPSSDVER
jgi:hypothetical protein